MISKCLICRKLSDLTTKKTAAVFITWKNECATAICHVLFGKNINYVASYLRKANYCSGCEQLVRDVSYVWKLIQSFKHQISDLSKKMYTLIDLNYQLIEEKSKPEITQERISLLLNTAVPMQNQDYSYEEMVEIIYSVVSNSLKPDLERFAFSDSSLSNNVDTHTNSVRKGSYDVTPEYFNVVNTVKEEYSDLEQQAVDDPIFNVDADKMPKIKSEHYDSYFDEFDESEKSSDFTNHEDLGLNVDEGSNSSSEFEVKEKKRKRGRPRLTLSQKLKRQMAKAKKGKPGRPPLTLIEKLKRKRTSTLYSCDEEGCGKKFTCEANKQIHIRQMHKGESKPYKCTQCERNFTSTNHLNRHLKRAHEEGKVWKTYNCKFCGAKHITLNELTSHYSVSHKETNPFLCAFCPELFQNSLDLTKHTKQSHHQPNVCKICDAVFTTPSLLSSHELKRHVGRAEWHQCSVCGKKWECQASLKVHMKSHEQSTMYKCDVCQLEFKSSFQLKSHSELHIEGVFTCKVCATVAPSLYDLKVHESTHSPKPTVERKSDKPKQRADKKIRPIKYNVECKFCGKGYFNEEELNFHYAVAHLGPNPFTCAFCLLICSNSVDLTRHMKFVHPDPNSNIGKLQCDSCHQYFANSQSLGVHKKTHLDPSLLLKCNLCSAVFKQRYYLKVHMETHSEEKKYVCDKCGKAYKRATSLNTHSRKHDETKRKYPCKICGKKFFTRAYCKSHERCHTNMKEFVCHVCGKGFNHDFNLREHLKIHAGVPTRRRPKLKLKTVEIDPKIS